MPSSDKAPRVLAFLCAWAPYRCFLESERTDLTIPDQVYSIKVPCGGRIDPGLILSAFEKGAAGVFVATCQEGDCRHGQGPAQSQEAAEAVTGLVHLLGIGPERFRIVSCSAHESEELVREMTRFVEGLDQPALPPVSAKAVGS